MMLFVAPVTFPKFVFVGSRLQSRRRDEALRVEPILRLIERAVTLRHEDPPCRFARRERGSTEEQLRKKIAAIDLRDGEQDNRITPREKKCPKCDVMTSPKCHRCLFCGHKDDSPGMI
jgi:hypothetical protein